LLQILLQRGIRLLGGRQTSGLQRLPQRLKSLRDRIALRPGSRTGVLGVTGAMMVVMLYLPGLLDVLLNGGEVFLRRREISRLEILRE
jgi:hypothetical protein